MQFSRWIHSNIRFRCGVFGHRRRHARLPSWCELLEVRQLLTLVTLTDQQQLLIELVNRTRANPSAEAALHNVGLNDGLPNQTWGLISTAPKQPLAPNQILADVAAAHAVDMIDRQFFSHTNPDGDGTRERTDAAGYAGGVGENLSRLRSDQTIDLNQQVYQQHRALFESPGHRANMLHPPHRELGTGFGIGVIPSDPRPNWLTVVEDFGIPGGTPFITGVAYTDTVVVNGFYDINEAVRSGTITAVSQADGRTYTTPVGRSGGYALQVPVGRYQVTLDDTYVASNVVVVDANMKVDFDTTSATRLAILSINLAANSVGEGDGPHATSLRVTRTGAVTSALTVLLSSDDPLAATVPSQVVIPAGQSTSPIVFIDAVDDFDVDGTQTATITAQALESRTAAVMLDVLDDDTFAFTVPDIDGDGAARTLSDGILLIRYLAGFRGQALVEDVVHSQGSRKDPQEITDWLDQRNTLWDADGDGQSLPLSDGILFARYLAGFTGVPLIDGAVNLAAPRSSPDQILQYLNNLQTAAAPVFSYAPHKRVARDDELRQTDNAHLTIQSTPAKTEFDQPDADETPATSTAAENTGTRDNRPPAETVDRLFTHLFADGVLTVF
jgi:hypothetical protein